MLGCKKCNSFCGVLVLIAGILFLLRDLGIWGFWNIQWFTVVFLLWGFGSLAGNSCPECVAMRTGKKK